ncbi:hypothetical protein, partial [Flavobacterium tistrianum]|uniref:hypothetical protein n=1 Tax=Flavobacterium tistrianum TaxID=1685414 RepID=UPI00194E62EC
KTFTEILPGNLIESKRDFRKKKIEKVLQDLKNAFTFAPRKYGKFIERLEEEIEKGSEKKASKFFHFFLA